ncbi:MAG: hypothetical protein K2G28_05195 [Acetatifactor sp.]|nr:hypothetical protein [Acetatifactor sp.]MDE7354228.1 hypothetical protein [Acetatifactor sp.]
MDDQKKKRKITIQDIALIGIMTAMLEVCKAALSFLPNVELVSFWIIMFTLFFSWRIAFVIPVFVLIEGCIYGFGSWWFMYLYVWPLLAWITYMNRRQQSIWFWSILSSVFGLMYGFFCTPVHGAMSIASGGFRNGLYAAFAWWVAGIPYDIIHGIGNFVVMAVCYVPVRRAVSMISPLPHCLRTEKEKK